jgi:uncharacterized protein YkwD
MKKTKTTAKRTKKKQPNKFKKWVTYHRHLAAGLAVALIMGVVGTAYYLQSSSALTTDIDRNSQAAVNSAYWSQWKASDVMPAWTGNVANCVAGTMGATPRANMLRAVNFARRMNHLAPVNAANDTANANAMKAALIMDANNALDHTPPDSWKCMTSGGKYAAGKSNLGEALPGQTSVSDAVLLYLNDNGPSNYFAGHRRYLLAPDATTFGFGMTTGAHAIQVLALATNTNNPNPAWTAWPTSGYFPDEIAPLRWSLTTGLKYYLKGASVSVTRNGVNVPVTKKTVVDGYANNTLVWDLPEGYAKSGTYSVTVKNIKRSSSSTETFSKQYTVKFFTPVKP